MVTTETVQLPVLVESSETGIRFRQMTSREQSPLSNRQIHTHGSRRFQIG